jgi:hypothetical protein
MKKETLIKVYRALSWLFMLAACVLVFIPEKGGLTLFGLIFSVAFRYLAERTKCKMIEKENAELKSDMRRLTNLLEELSKKETK